MTAARLHPGFGPRARSVLWPLLGVAWVLAFAGLAASSLAGCANPLLATKQAVAISAKTIDETGQALSKIDAAELHRIATTAPSQAEADAGIAAWQAKRQKVYTALVAAQQVVNATAAAVSLAELGMRKETSLAAYLPDLLRAAESVQAALAALGIALPPPTPAPKPSAPEVP